MNIRDSNIRNITQFGPVVYLYVHILHLELKIIIFTHFNAKKLANHNRAYLHRSLKGAVADKKMDHFLGSERIKTGHVKKRIWLF